MRRSVSPDATPPCFGTLWACPPKRAIKGPFRNSRNQPSRTRRSKVCGSSRKFQQKDLRESRPKSPPKFSKFPASKTLSTIRWLPGPKAIELLSFWGTEFSSTTMTRKLKKSTKPSIARKSPPWLGIPRETSSQWGTHLERYLFGTWRRTKTSSVLKPTNIESGQLIGKN